MAATRAVQPQPAEPSPVFGSIVREVGPWRVPDIEAFLQVQLLFCELIVEEAPGVIRTPLAGSLFVQRERKKPAGPVLPCDSAFGKQHLANSTAKVLSHSPGRHLRYTSVLM